MMAEHQAERAQEHLTGSTSSDTHWDGLFSIRPCAADPETEQRRLDDTIAFWSGYTSGSLTETDAVEIRANLSGFFKTLAQWAAASPCGATGTTSGDATT